MAKKNQNFKYKMRDQNLDDEQEKYLGTIININLKMSDQCTAASKKANIRLSQISRKLYTAFVRPHLE